MAHKTADICQLEKRNFSIKYKDSRSQTIVKGATGRGGLARGVVVWGGGGDRMPTRGGRYKVWH